MPEASAQILAIFDRAALRRVKSTTTRKPGGEDRSTRRRRMPGVSAVAIDSFTLPNYDSPRCCLQSQRI